MRFLILSNSPHQHTGYGRQTKYLSEIATALGHEVGVVALSGVSGNAIHWHDIPIFAQTDVRNYCLDEMPHYVSYFNADAVISLYDLWHFPPDTAQRIGVPWIAMVPIEGAPIRGYLPRLLRTASYVVTYSEYGERHLLEASVPNTMIPHCVDTSVFAPGEQAIAREALRMPEDKFIVTMVAMNKGNPPFRKAWPEMMRAWKMFSSGQDDVLFYAHTNKKAYTPSVTSGFRFEPLVEDLGIDWATLAFPDAENFTVGVPDEQMAMIYRASDAVILPSMAEGFGLPVIEAQACGTPMIIHDVSAMSELLYHGYAFPQGEPLWIPERNYWWHKPEVDDIVHALSSAYHHRNDDDAEKEAEFGVAAMQKHYSIEAVAPLWDRFLDQVERELW